MSLDDQYYAQSKQEKIVSDEMKPDLFPCPFCGEKPAWHPHPFHGDRTFELFHSCDKQGENIHDVNEWQNAYCWKELSKSQSRVKELNTCLFQMQEAAKDLVSQNEKLKSELGEAVDLIRRCVLRFGPGSDGEKDEFDKKFRQVVYRFLSRHEKGEIR